MPIGAANDEPAQLVKAASVARGQIVGPRVSPKLLAETPPGDRVDFNGCAFLSSVQRCSAADTVVTVPSSFGDLSRPECFTVFQQVPAGCDVGLRGSDRQIKATTYVGRYPPLYYAIVGLPSLASSTDTGVYLMRLVSGLLSAIFLGLALALAAYWSRSRMLVAAVSVAASSMVVLFSSVVNPSGLECATAICVWTGGLILVLDQSARPRPSVVIATAAAASVMVLTRSLSPLWLAIIAISLVVLAPRSIATLVGWTRVRVAAGVTGAIGVVAVGYILWANALSVYPIGVPVARTASELTIVRMAVGRSPTIVRELVGAFGWAATSPPDPILALWLIAALLVVGAGLAVSRRRHACLVVALMVSAFVLPIVLMASQARRDGVVWQARDGFPLYAGVLLVAGAVAFRKPGKAIGEDYETRRNLRLVRRLTVVIAVCVAVAQLGDFLWALRRYTVGLGPVLNPFAHVHGGWSPPVPAAMLGIIATVVAAFYGWWIVRLSSTVIGPELGDGSEASPEDVARSESGLIS